MTNNRKNILLAALFTAISAPALATGDLPPLKENKHIDERLFAAGLSAAVRDYCPSISMRKTKAAWEGLKLYNYARRQGYSHDVIKAYLDSQENQDWLKERLTEHLKGRGVSEDDPESFCAVGREEIRNNTIAGGLLRED